MMAVDNVMVHSVVGHRAVDFAPFLPGSMETARSTNSVRHVDIQAARSSLSVGLSQRPRTAQGLHIEGRQFEIGCRALEACIHVRVVVLDRR